MAPVLTLPTGRAVVCIGFMGAGKSTAARSAAEALRTQSIDVDEQLVKRFGKPIERVFAEEGESTFRAAEEQLTLELLGSDETRVLSLGGGGPMSAKVRQALREHLTIWVDVEFETAWIRARGTGRPLARDHDAFARLYAEREPVYAALGDVIIPAQRTTSLAAVLAALQGAPADVKLLWAASESGDYPAYIGPGLIAEHRFWPQTIPGRRFLVTDGNAGRLYGEALQPAGGRVAIMPGEQSKTVAHAEIVWTELARSGMTRQDVVVALGGGVVGDLAGFCAATYQRGVRFVQVPTTLVAQVDSAYGGKTGVDLAEAKNYVGAYHQPKAVIADTKTLSTLPEAEIAAGYAEVVKTALIAGGDLWERVRQGAAPTDSDVITACARTKLRIVARDERDGGLRQTLNLGHTVGHAIETATGYARYRHGEAVGLGLLAALRLSGQEDLRAEVKDLLMRQELPTSLSPGDPDAETIVAATAKDKKRVGEAPTPFVLLDAPGEARPGCPVDPGELLSAVRELGPR